MGGVGGGAGGGLEWVLGWGWVVEVKTAILVGSHLDLEGLPGGMGGSQTSRPSPRQCRRARRRHRRYSTRRQCHRHSASSRVASLSSPSSDSDAPYPQSRQLLTTYYLLLTTYCLLLTTSYFLLTTHYCLLTTYCSYLSSIQTYEFSNFAMAYSSELSLCTSLLGSRRTDLVARTMRRWV